MLQTLFKRFLCEVFVFQIVKFQYIIKSAAWRQGVERATTGNQRLDSSLTVEGFDLFFQTFFPYTQQTIVVATHNFCSYVPEVTMFLAENKKNI